MIYFDIYLELWLDTEDPEFQYFDTGNIDPGETFSSQKEFMELVEDLEYEPYPDPFIDLT